MNWVKSCLKHKLTIYLLALALSLLGIVALFMIPVTPFPLPPSKSISIEIDYPGANANAVQSQIIQRLANTLQSVNNIEYVQGSAQAGSGFIRLGVNSTKPEDLLQTQINISQAISSSNLPSSASQPFIHTSMSSSSLITFMITADKWSLFQLDNFIQSTLSPKFSSIPGVALDTPTQQPEIKIELDPKKLAALHLSATKLSSLIDAAYKTNPLGIMHVQNEDYLLNLSGNIDSLQAFDNLVIGYQTGTLGRPIYLKDVANTSFTERSITDTSFHSYQGHVADGIDLFTHGVSNPFAASRISKAYVASLQSHLPSWIHIYPIDDTAQDMKKAISEVIFTILVATALVLAIALIFLGHLRTTIIPIITVPICLLGAIAIMFALGLSINLLSLLALVIAVGLVVDDAIVVVENITRHLEMGMNKLDAILHGTTDIALTVIGITATLLAVYLPIAFCTGVFIGFLKAFAIPLASAVLISGILALTLTPIMAVTFISDAPQNNYQKQFTRCLNAIIKVQHNILGKLLKFPLISLITIVVLIIIGGYYSLKIPQEYFPADPYDYVHIYIDGTASDTVKSLKQKVKKFSSFYNNQKVASYSVRIDPNEDTHQLSARISLQYKPQYLHQDAHFADLINAYIKKHHISNTYAKMMKEMNAGDTDFNVHLYGDLPVDKINQIVTKINKIMNKSDIFSMANNSIGQLQKQLSFHIDTVKAAKFGIFKDQISQLLSTYYGGYQLNNYFNIAGLTVPIVVQLNKHDLKDPQAIQSLQIQSPLTGDFLPLDEFVQLHLTAKPIRINTFNGQPSVEIFGNLAKGQSLGTAIDYINHLFKTFAPSLQYQYVGQAESYIEGNSQTKLVLGLGIVCVYLLLAVLFGNLTDPFIILLTVPFSIVGGALSLYLVDGSYNIFSIFGLITLVGLITKHGVLIVQFANNELKTKQCSIREAVLTATHHRFRPIMMTTLAMTLGALPLVVSSEHMYVSRQNLGIVIIGGLIVGTIFSVFIVPLVYTLIKRVKSKK